MAELKLQHPDGILGDSESCDIPADLKDRIAKWTQTVDSNMTLAVTGYELAVELSEALPDYTIVFHDPLREEMSHSWDPPPGNDYIEYVVGDKAIPKGEPPGPLEYRIERRVGRIRRLLELRAPEVIIENEMRMLQELRLEAGMTPSDFEFYIQTLDASGKNYGKPK